jgi:anti-anti-sigma regulatory factor
MTFKVEKIEEAKEVVLKLSGRIQKENVAELERLFETKGTPDLVLDLEEVKLVDRDVVLFLESCQENGARLRNCPPYIRQWMDQQHDRKS